MAESVQKILLITEHEPETIALYREHKTIVICHLETTADHAGVYTETYDVFLHTR